MHCLAHGWLFAAIANFRKVSSAKSHSAIGASNLAKPEILTDPTCKASAIGASNRTPLLDDDDDDMATLRSQTVMAHTHTLHNMLPIRAHDEPIINTTANTNDIPAEEPHSGEPQAKSESRGDTAKRQAAEANTD